MTCYLTKRLKHVEDVTDSRNRPLDTRKSVESQERYEAIVNPVEEQPAAMTAAVVPPILISHHPHPHHHAQTKARCDFGDGRSSTAKMYASSMPGSFGKNTQIGLEQGSPIKAPQRPPPQPPVRSESKDLGREYSARTPESSLLEAKRIFKPIEEYIIESFLSRECINTSFSSLRPNGPQHTASADSNRPAIPATVEDIKYSDDTLSGMDAKTLLVGDIAENGSWWTGRRTTKKLPDRSRSFGTGKSSDASSTTSELVNSKSPHIDWIELEEWYRMVLYPGKDWQFRLRKLRGIQNDGSVDDGLSLQLASDIGNAIGEAQLHVQRVLLKATETLLKRPGAPLKRPADTRFLLIVLANPLLYPSYRPHNNRPSRSGSRVENRGESRKHTHSGKPPWEAHTGPTSSKPSANAPGRHSGIIKRVLGLLSNLPNECHHYLVAWFKRFPEINFRRLVELIGSFVTYRLTRQHGKKVSTTHDATAGLIPTLSASGYSSSAALHAALGLSGQPAKKEDGASKPVVYDDDWQIKAAARVMALIFSANTCGRARKTDLRIPLFVDPPHHVRNVANESVHRHGHIVPTSSFYNTLLDYSDLVADFESWEQKKSKFAFCQYPFFLSIWAKIQIMEYDARRQMEVKAREAFFDSIMTRKVIQQYLILNVRRECLVEDSLKAVSQVVGSGGEEIKKGLRIQFKGEEGIDGGGLRKEWFLLLVRDVFNPEHGNCCNPPSLGLRS